MNAPRRRQFLGQIGQGLGGMILIANTSLLLGCAAPPPRPFIAGNIATAPIGCTELLARDPRGDC